MRPWCLILVIFIQLKATTVSKKMHSADGLSDLHTTFCDCVATTVPAVVATRRAFYDDALCFSEAQLLYGEIMQIFHHWSLLVMHPK